MASANLDLVRSIYAVWERGDFTSASLAPATEWAHPDIEYVMDEVISLSSWTRPAGLGEGTRTWPGRHEPLRS